MPELLGDLLKGVIDEKLKKQLTEIIVGQYRFLYLMLEAQLPHWIPELALDLAVSLTKLEDKSFVKEQIIYSITAFLRAKNCKNLTIIDNFEQLKGVLLSSDEDYFEKLDKLLGLIDKQLVPEAERLLEAWFRLVREGHIKRKKYGNTLYEH
ncbi:MAG: hypothetical protein R3E08_15040 [Thiotrichaceae bacterium]